MWKLCPYLCHHVERVECVAEVAALTAAGAHGVDEQGCLCELMGRGAHTRVNATFTYMAINYQPA